MDPELVEYLDRRFSQFGQEFRTELRQEISGLRDAVRDELRQGLGGLRDESRDELRQGLGGLRDELRTDIAISAAETRRHFDVVAEQLMHTIQLVGEGVVAIDQRVDRLTTEMRAEFQKVDRRFLHLEARIVPAGN